MNKFLGLVLCVATASGRAAGGGYSAPAAHGGGSFIGGSSNFGGGGGGSSFSSIGSSNFGGGGSSFSSVGSSSFGGGSSFGSSGGSFGTGGGSGGSGGGLSFGDGCGNGQVRGGDGGCVTPTVTRNIFLYAAPKLTAQVGPRPALPAPKVHYNFVFVRTPTLAGGSRAIVAPAPKQKTLVYVLSKRPGAAETEVLQTDFKPTRPEVFFVNYNQGDNAALPGGVSLQEALSQSVQQGQVINGGGVGGGVGGGIGGGVGGGISGGIIGVGGSGGGISGGSINGGIIGVSNGGQLSGSYSAP